MFSTRSMLAAVIVCLGLTVAIPATAQNGLCQPDCPSAAWSAMQEHIMTLPGGCQMRVHYATRLAACSGIPWQDINIAYIEPVDPFNVACAGVSLFPTKTILDMVTDQLLQEKATLGCSANAADPDSIFCIDPPDADGCTTQWRVVNGTCWTKQKNWNIEPELYDVAALQPCFDQPACCLKPYKVCIDSCGNPSSESLGTGTGSTETCNSYAGEECEPVCG